jgi:hypothetical protein
MKTFWCLLLVSFLGARAGFAQDGTIQLSRIYLNQVPFKASKEQIVQRLGTPNKTDESKHVCGALSTSGQSQKMQSLHYSQALFTGNPQNGYVLEAMTFSPITSGLLMYGPWKLGGKTTLKDLQLIFGRSLSLENVKGGTGDVLVPSAGSDGAIFTFKEGRLTKFEYWSPC